MTMQRILDIAVKDLTQILRNRLTFLFLLIMPIAFTLLFGLAFSGNAPAGDPRLPVGFLDQDGGQISTEFRVLLLNSTVIRLDEQASRGPSDLEKLVSDGKMAAAVIIPKGNTQSIQDGTTMKLILLADSSITASQTVEGEIQAALNRLASAVRIGQVVSQVLADPATFQPAFNSAASAWEQPPVKIMVTSSEVVRPQNSKIMSLANSSPSMMLQFAIAGLLTAATIIVSERKTRSLQRLLTTATSRTHILLGHYLAIFGMVFGQFVLLILFGQLALKVNYLHQPFATLLVAVTAAACISAIGLLIGVFAKSEEQAIIFSLLPMFILSGLGGAWVPLEATSATFQAVGHFSPVAWAMDGFKNVTVRLLGIESVLIPSAALVGYALFFFLLAVWRFRRASE
jgi:ABC-2 type transport system permease protein